MGNVVPLIVVSVFYYLKIGNEHGPRTGSESILDADVSKQYMVKSPHIHRE